MVPSEYDAYLATTATAAAALIGLLFVAVSVRDDTIFGPNAMPGGEALAITAFTGLVNSFVVSMFGLIPKINVGEPAVIMAVISIAAIVRLQRRLHTGRNLTVLGITLLAYAGQRYRGDRGSRSAAWARARTVADPPLSQPVGRVLCSGLHDLRRYRRHER